MGNVSYVTPSIHPVIAIGPHNSVRLAIGGETAAIRATGSRDAMAQRTLRSHVLLALLLWSRKIMYRLPSLSMGGGRELA